MEARRMLEIILVPTITRRGAGIRPLQRFFAIYWHCFPLCFAFARASDDANSAAIAVSTKTSVHTQKSSNSSGKSYKNAFLLHRFTMQFCLDVIGVRVPRHLLICLHGHELCHFFINTRVVSTVNKWRTPFQRLRTIE